MSTIDLSAFDDDGFVLHFGGRANEVDALTFGNALVSVAEAIRAINQEVNAGFAIEVAIDAVGPINYLLTSPTTEPPRPTPPCPESL